MENYEFLHSVGSGAQGVTFKVRHKITGEVFAMKCIGRGSEVDQNVEREILNHRVLYHPNVVQFKEVVLDDKKLGIVMEYAECGELRQKVQLNGAFSEPKARKMFQKLIAGVSYIHSMHICHRDLKLDNTLLARNDGLKICDLGLSKSSVLHSTPKSRVGTQYYWAPEVNNSPEKYNGKLADVWSCGVTLYHMLTRGPPPANLNMQETSIPLSEECKDLLSRIFVENPDERITIDEIKKHSWYLKNLPKDLTEEAQAVYRNKQNVTIPSQSKEDIIKIVHEARNLPRVLEIDEEAGNGLEDLMEMENVEES